MHKKQVVEDIVARCVIVAVTVTITSHDRIENGCGIPYVKHAALNLLETCLTELL